jgi:RHS repeat-associated protein
VVLVLLVQLVAVALLSPPNALAQPTWTELSTLPSNVQIVGSDLLSISCPTMTECLAGGSLSNGGGGVVVETLNGGASWAEPTISTTAGVEVSCLSATDCVAANGFGVYLQTALAGVFTEIPSGNLPSGVSGVSNLTCLAGSSDCYASAGDQILESSNSGENWIAVYSPGEQTLSNVHSITCWINGGCLIAGAEGYDSDYTPAFYWTLGSWTNVYVRPLSTESQPYPLNALSCPSYNYCVAGGDGYGNPESSTYTFTAPQSATTSTTLCVSDQACVIAGSGANPLYGTSTGGKSWSAESVPSDVQSVGDIACAATNLCLAVGDSDTSGGVVLLDGGDPLTQGGPQGGACAGSETFGAGNEAESSCGAAASLTDIGPESGEISALTGDFTLGLSSFSLPGPGGPLVVSENYNSLAAATSGPLGPGWSLGPAETLSIAPGSGDATITEGNGATVTFTPQASSAPYCPVGDNQDPTGPAPMFSTYFCAPERVQAHLSYSAATLDYTYFIDNQTTVVFVPTSSSSLWIISTSTDDNENVTSFTWNMTTSPPQLASVTNPAGRSVMLGYYPSGLLETITDDQLTTRAETFAYASGNLQSITDPNGDVTSFGYSTSSPPELTSVVSPNDQPPHSGQTTVTYVPGGGVVQQVTDPMSNVWTFNVSGSNSLVGGDTLVTDPHDNEVLDTYSFGELDSTTTGSQTSAAQTTQLSYDPATALVTMVVGPEGQTSTFGYNSTGDLICSSTPNETAQGDTCPTSGSPPPGTVTTYTYDASNKVLADTPPVGAPTLNTYNSITINGVHGTNNGPNILTSTLQGATDTGDPAPNLVTTYSYCTSCGGFKGLVSSIQTPDGATVYYTYDAYGDTASVATEPSTTKDTTENTYDPDGELWCSTSPDASAGGVTCPTWPTAVTTPDTTADTYDDDGNVLTTTGPTDKVTTYSYDADANLYETIAPGTSSPNTSETTYTTYDSDDRPTSITTGYGTSASATAGYRYDLAPAVAPCSSLTGATYCEAVEEPDGVSAGSGYWTVDYYDASNRLIEVTDAGTDVSTAYSYDVTVGSGTCTSMPASTALCNVATNESGSDPTTTTAYDNDGNTTGVRYSSGSPEPVTYGYDALDRVTSMQQVSGSSMNVTEYAYDGDGRETTVAYTPAGGSATATTYGYDGDDDVTCISDPIATTTSCLDAGNTTGTGLVNYTYDGANRMLSVADWNSKTTSFPAYDADDNLKTTDLPNGDAISSSFDNDDGISASAVSGTSDPPSWSDTRYGNESVEAETDMGALNASASYLYDARNEVASDNTTLFAYDKDANPTTFQNGVTQSLVGGTDQLSSVSDGGLTTAYGYDAFGDRTSATTSTTTIGHIGIGVTNTYNQASELTSVAPTGPVVGNLPVTASISSDHSLFVLPNGDVEAAGSNTDGQLGNGTTSSTPSTTPVAVDFSGSPDVIQVAAGVGFSVALDSAGNVWTWGWGTDGQLGNGTTSGNVTRPHEITPGALGTVKVTQIAAGEDTVYALGADNNVYSWANNNDDQLGDPTAGSNSDIPVVVYEMNDVRQIGAGDNFGAALTTGNKIWEWGLDSNGELGNGESGTNESTRVFANKAGESTVSMMSVAGSNVTDLLSSGAVYSWGLNNNGQLGQNTTTGPATCSSGSYCSTIPVQVTIGLSGVVVTAVDQINDTAFALSSTGQLYGWGMASDGELGNDTVTQSPVPEVVGNGESFFGTGVSANSAIAVTPAGTVYAWGKNASGQLGVGNSTNEDVPTAVSGVTSTGAATTASSSYTYDGNGLRTTATVNGVAASYTWNTVAPIPQLLSDGTNNYVYGPGGLPIEQITLGGTEYFFHDALGSTRALLGASGAVAATYSYDAYGAGSAASSNAAATPLLFGGQYFDSASGLYYLVNRYYDPSTGQFLTVDPLVGVTDQPYAYTAGDPVNLVDPGATEVDPPDPAGSQLAGPDSDGGGGGGAGGGGSAGGDSGGIGASPVASGSSVPPASSADGTSAAETPTGLSQPAVGDTIYRVYGGDSKAGGASWTPVDPDTVENYRDVAGLPSGGETDATNTGQFVIEGVLEDPEAVVTVRGAVALPGTKGGLPEYVIPDWMDNGAIRIVNVSGANPEF